MRHAYHPQSSATHCVLWSQSWHRRQTSRRKRRIFGQIIDSTHTYSQNYSSKECKEGMFAYKILWTDLSRLGQRAIDVEQSQHSLSCRHRFRTSDCSHQGHWCHHSLFPQVQVGARITVCTAFVLPRLAQERGINSSFLSERLPWDTRQTINKQLLGNSGIRCPHFILSVY